MRIVRQKITTEQAVETLCRRTYRRRHCPFFLGGNACKLISL